jgi:hypothetical protein
MRERPIEFVLERSVEFVRFLLSIDILDVIHWWND